MNGYVSRTQNGETGYFMRNAHGDILKAYGEDNTLLADYTYDAWGNGTKEDGSWRQENPIRYAGEYADSESGMIYLRARYYAPELGRFISEDPIKDGLNWYAYCDSNPVMRVDPSGFADESTQKLNVLENMIMDLVSIKAEYHVTYTRYQEELARQEDARARGDDYEFDEGAYKDKLNQLNIQADSKRTEILDYLENNLKDNNVYVIVKGYMEKGIWKRECMQQ